MDSTQVVVQARTGDEGTCPYCRGVFVPGERRVECDGCRTTSHEECLQELGRCPTAGCAGSRASPREVAPRSEDAVAEVAPIETTGPARVVVQARSSSDESCPYCRGPFEPGERPVVCEGCRTSYHEDCRRELGRCSTRGCASAVAGATRAEVVSQPPGVDPLEAVYMAIVVAVIGGLAVFLTDFLSGWATALFVMFLTVVAVVVTVARRPSQPRRPSWLPPPTPTPIRPPALTPTPIRPPPPPPPVVPPPLPVVPAECLACSGSFAPGERLQVCEGCTGRYHPECLARIGHCAGAGCAGRRAVPGRARAR